MRRREFLFSAYAAPRLPAAIEFIEGAVNVVRVGGRVLLTHCRRDVVWAAAGATAVAPAGEIGLLTDPAEFWRQFQTARFHDYAQQSSRVPVKPFPKATSVVSGERIGTRIEA